MLLQDMDRSFYLCRTMWSIVDMPDGMLQDKGAHSVVMPPTEFEAVMQLHKVLVYYLNGIILGHRDGTLRDDPAWMLANTTMTNLDQSNAVYRKVCLKESYLFHWAEAPAAVYGRLSSWCQGDDEVIWDSKDVTYTLPAFIATLAAFRDQ